MRCFAIVSAVRALTISTQVLHALSMSFAVVRVFRRYSIRARMCSTVQSCIEHVEAAAAHPHTHTHARACDRPPPQVRCRQKARLTLLAHCERTSCINDKHLRRHSARHVSLKHITLCALLPTRPVVPNKRSVSRKRPEDA